MHKLLPWLAAFGVVTGIAGWAEMFLVNETASRFTHILNISLMILQPVSGFLLLAFGWGIFSKLIPLPRWAIFVPGILIVPFAYVITYAISTFITPSPIQIPLDIWSRYLLYLPGSILAGLGFLRQWNVQRKQGYLDVATLMLGAGIAFMIEAFVMGMVVPAAPYGPASYYNYDRVEYEAYSSDRSNVTAQFGLTAWLDYQAILDSTGLPIQFWRMLSAFAVTGFVIRGLDVFEAVQKRKMLKLQDERDKANQAALNAQISALEAAESWSNALVRINSQIAKLEDVDSILMYIVENARTLFAADYLGLALVDGKPTQLLLRYYATQAKSEYLEQYTPVENKHLLDVINSQKAYCSLPGERVENFEDVCLFSDVTPSILAAIPLQMETTSIGLLWITREAQNVFSETDMIWLECLADQIVIAIQHGVMTAQLQSLSVSEERNRIAREMHDGLAQVLGYLNVQVQTLDAYLEQGKLDRLQEKLQRMRMAVDQAHADVREKILSLRTTLSNEKGFIPSIEEYLEEFGIQAQITTKFENFLVGEPNITSLAEVQLVCILQEALTNVRKHSQAQNVKVNLGTFFDAGDEKVRLVVTDDGSGMVKVKNKDSYGIQIMQERAQSVGGIVEILSVPGKGTKVKCIIPCHHRERVGSLNKLGEAKID